jgi:hypothetical protein
MADTLPSVPVPPNDWIELYTATGIAPGTRLNLQVDGHHPVEAVYAPAKPTTQKGFVLYPLVFKTTREGEPKIWVSTREAAKVSSIKVLIAGDVSDSVTIEGTTYSKLNITGRFYAGAQQRLGVTIANTPYYNVITAGPEGLAIDDVIVEADFADTTDGQFGYQISCYVDDSDGNDWTYTPGTPIPPGRATNGAYINDPPQSTIEIDVAATVNSGVFDYLIFFTKYYVDVGGNRNVQTKAETRFFDADRQILLAPGQQMLIEATITGNATGTADIKTIFFLAE